MVKLCGITKYFRWLLSKQEDKSLLFLQGYLELTVSKCPCLCFVFGDSSGKNNWKEINDCRSLSRGLPSGQSSVMIIDLHVNTRAKYGASIYVCTLILSKHNKSTKK